MAAKPVKPGLFDQLKMPRESGAVPAFVIISGLIISVGVFIALYFMTSDLKSQEANNLTRDVVRVTQQTTAGIEQFTKAMAYHFATQEGRGFDDAVVTFFNRGLPEIRSINHIAWVTQNGVWYRRSLDSGEIVGRETNVQGLPSWTDLRMRLGNADGDKVVILNNMPWMAVAGMSGDGGERNIGFAYAQRLAGNGGVGYLLVAARPSRVFAGAMNVRRDDLASLSITDISDGAAFLNKRYSLSAAKADAQSEEVPASYVLEVGDHLWRMDFSVHPTKTTVLLSWLPWFLPGLIVLLSMATAYLLERKGRRDREMAKISKTLEGANSELQNRIGERDRLFSALKKSEREHRVLINCISEVIFEIDSTGRLVFLNDAWERIVGSSPDKSLRRSLFDLLRPEDQVTQRSMFDDMLVGQRQSYRVETALRTAAGYYKPVELAFSMIRLCDDQSVHAVGTITDIEKRRQAEDAVRKVERKAREIVENAVSGLYQSTPDGQFISANPALAEMLGYSSPDELMSAVTGIGHQIYVSREDRERFTAMLEKEGRVTEYESELCRRDGTRIWVVENARVVRGEGGETAYYEGSLWDITARKKADAALREARMQAEMSSRAKMDFIANMSHELRTPLNVIIGFAEVIKNEIMGPIGIKVYQEYAKDIYESGNNLLKIISDILEVSKIESGQRELKESAFHIRNTLKSCMTILGARIEMAGHTLTVDIPDNMPELIAEEIGIKQVLINLIGNAIKFTPRGGRLGFAARIDAEGRAVLEISDNGAGMTADELKKSLQPFGQVETDLARDSSGTGLGLTIVQSLVRLHGGTFELQSEKGRGTMARVTLPKSRVYISAKKRQNAAKA